MTTISVKNGETFSRECTWKIDGVGVNLTGYTVTCRGLDKSGAAVDIAATLGNQGTAPGSFTISATSTQTAAWKIGTMSVDVSFASGGGVVSKSATFAIDVERSPTP